MKRSFKKPQHFFPPCFKSFVYVGANQQPLINSHWPQLDYRVWKDVDTQCNDVEERVSEADGCMNECEGGKKRKK